MFGSDILEVAIGLIFVYVLFSLIVSTLTEMIESFFGRRAKDLEKAVIQLIGEATKDEFYDHALIKSLTYPAKNPKKGPKPSYVQPATFAKVVLDLVRQNGSPNPDQGLIDVKRLRMELEHDPDATVAKDRFSKFISSVEPVTKVWCQIGKAVALPSTDLGQKLKSLKKIYDELDKEDPRFKNLADKLEDFTILKVPDDTNEKKRKEIDKQIAEAQLPTLVQCPSEQTVAELKRLQKELTSETTVQQIADAVETLIDRLEMYDVFGLIKELPDELGKPLAALARESQESVQQLKANMEKWFDDTMDRLGGWYKRHAMWVSFIAAGVVVGCCNVDTIQIVDSLVRNPTLRESVVATAESYAAERKQREDRLAGERVESVEAGLGLSNNDILGGEKIDVWVTLPQTVSESEAKYSLSVVDSPDGIAEFARPKSDKDSQDEGVVVTAKKKDQQPETVELKTVAVDEPLTVVIQAKSGNTVLERLLTIRPTPLRQVEYYREMAGKLQLPMGWPDPRMPWGDESTRGVWEFIGWLLLKVVGLSLTALAVSLGAPFWFDILNKFVRLRNSLRIATRDEAPTKKGKPKEQPAETG